MNDVAPPETPAGRPVWSSRRTVRLVRRTFAALARSWHDTRYLNERLLAANRPWEQLGPLRWQHEAGSWRIVGSYLPDDPPGHRPP
jgi:hypothetical protein